MFPKTVIDKTLAVRGVKQTFISCGEFLKKFERERNVMARDGEQCRGNTGANRKGLVVDK